MQPIVETLAWLVDIPSPTGEEARIRDAIAERLSSLECRPVRDSLVVGSPGPSTTLLVGHLDTVPLQGRVGARVEDGRVHGLGSTDMKGGLAVMIHLLESLGTGGLAAVFYAGEEGPIAANQLGDVLDAVPGTLDSPAGIVLEPTNREVQAGCNGVINARVSFVGEPAHSARPWLGENAVSKAGLFLSSLHRREPEDHVIDGLVFREVVSVTRAVGGVANNVIPGRFELNVNYRFAPDRTTEDAVNHIRAICSDADEVEITDLGPSAPPSLDNPLFDDLASAAKADVTPKQGWTDVAQLAARGIPAINFGPGETDLAHKPGESVRIDDLVWAFDALEDVLGAGRRR